MGFAALILTLSLAHAAFAAPPSPGESQSILSSSQTSGSAAIATPGVVDGPTARRLVAAGVKVVDVRTRAEFDGGHVPGALNIPYDEIDRRLEEIGPPSTPVVLYCRSGRRSGIAARVLEGKGFREVYDLRAYDLWLASEPRR